MRLLLVALLPLPALVACTPLRSLGFEPDAGCIGACGSNGGNDGGADGGSDAGTAALTTIAELRATEPVGAHVRVENAVVSAVGKVRFACAGVVGVGAELWIADSTRQQSGIFVEKYCSNPPVTYLPQAGDVLSVDGFVARGGPAEDRAAYRLMLRDDFGRSGAPLTLYPSAQRAQVYDVQIASDAGFGGADGGRRAANPERAGARIHLAGPLAIEDAEPAALERYFLGQASGNDGYQLSGGVLVSDAYLPRTLPDGGAGCAWGERARDGGIVTFPAGISGVWDSYAHSPCIDGGVAGDGGYCLDNGYQPAYVPGADASYTLVLYPMTCADAPADAGP